jgi:hypothetical protein
MLIVESEKKSKCQGGMLIWRNVSPRQQGPGGRGGPATGVESPLNSALRWFFLRHGQVRVPFGSFAFALAHSLSSSIEDDEYGERSIEMGNNADWVSRTA